MPATLRRGDGYRNKGTVVSMPQVRMLQRALRRAGFAVDTDGLFGAATERAVKALQKDRGLLVDGVVGPATWRLLAPYLGKRDAPPHYDHIAGLESFHGDLDWIHRREGHAGRPYWPGGRSGVTLDPGFDLGYQTLARVTELYGSMLRQQQLNAVARALGKRGGEARTLLASDGLLRSIRISRTRALTVMPQVAVKYWTPASRRFPTAAEPATPDSVQTVLLSLAYNRGARNRGLAVLRRPVSRRNWLEVARQVGAMQQDHPLAGIRKRRRMEADLILSQLDTI